MYLLSTINNNDINSSYVCNLHDTWHYRLSHANKKTLYKMALLKVKPKTSASTSPFKCKYCAQGKLTKKAFKSITRSSSILQLVHFWHL